jgi:hypothetical protein
MGWFSPSHGLLHDGTQLFDGAKTFFQKRHALYYGRRHQGHIGHLFSGKDANQGAKTEKDKKETRPV